jgi:hypothetical protein
MTARRPTFQNPQFYHSAPSPCYKLLVQGLIGFSPFLSLARGAHRLLGLYIYIIGLYIYIIRIFKSLACRHGAASRAPRHGVGVSIGFSPWQGAGGSSALLPLPPLAKDLTSRSFAPQLKQGH